MKLCKLFLALQKKENKINYPKADIPYKRFYANLHLIDDIKHENVQTASHT